MIRFAFLFFCCLLELDAFSQTNLLTESFDSTPTNSTPIGWGTTGSGGWYADSSNFSSGYSNASGMKNLVIRNTVASGSYSIQTPPISTTSFAYIGLTWASRNSSNYTTSGSTTPLLEYSIDGGTSWTGVAYIENASNSTWGLVNNNNWVMLPSNAAGQTDLRIRWTVNIVNSTQGSYRMDDINLVAANTQFSDVPVLTPSNGFSIIQTFVNNKLLVCNVPFEAKVTIYNISGSVINTMPLTPGDNIIAVDQLTTGIYLASTIISGNHIVTKFSKQ